MRALIVALVLGLVFGVTLPVARLSLPLRAQTIVRGPHFLAGPPTVSGFCSGVALSGAAYGTDTFSINVGTGCAASTGTITFPAAPTAWVVTCHNVTSAATNFVDQTSGSTTTAGLTNFVRTTGVAGNFTDSHILRCHATWH